MENTPTTETAPTPEALAVQQLDIVAERAFAEYEPRRIGAEGSVDTQEVIVSLANQTVVWRTTAADGGVSYRYADSQWQSTEDRGSANYRWTRGSSSVSRYSSSELNGDNPGEELDSAGIGQLSTRFEDAFPARTEVVAPKLMAISGLMRWVRQRFSRH